jgi:hypothetical protein
MYIYQSTWLLLSETVLKKLVLTVCFFATCIVVQLSNVNQQYAHFLKINILIQFFLFSTCFEHHAFVSRKTINVNLKDCTFLFTIFNVAPCMLPHLLFNPTHALFTL